MTVLGRSGYQTFGGQKLCITDEKLNKFQEKSSKNHFSFIHSACKIVWIISFSFTHVLIA